MAHKRKIRLLRYQISTLFLVLSCVSSSCHDLRQIIWPPIASVPQLWNGEDSAALIPWLLNNFSERLSVGVCTVPNMCSLCLFWGEEAPSCMYHCKHHQLIITGNFSLYLYSSRGLFSFPGHRNDQDRLTSSRLHQRTSHGTLSVRGLKVFSSPSKALVSPVESSAQTKEQRLSSSFGTKTKRNLPLNWGNL